MEKQAKLLELLDRSMFVDADEVKRHLPWGDLDAMARPAERFATRWEALLRKLGLLLQAPSDPNFLKQVREMALQIASLPDSCNDQMLFLIIRHDYRQAHRYPEVHSLQVAALCHLVSRRLGWSEDQRLSLIGAALTMNLGMASLQAKLADQRLPPTPIQRKEIDAHPTVSAALLRAAGLTDAAWLQAVEQHHECPDGSGYPKQIREPSEMSQLIRFIDRFTAKYSPRLGRDKQQALQAAKDLYAQSGGNPLAAVLIKECGLYPPGCFVKLASGESAVVIRRGATLKEPLVAALTNIHGEPLARPVQRDTAQPERAIVGTLKDQAITVHVSAEKLYD